MTNLQAQWIVGFTDGEGHFGVSINRHKGMTTGYQVQPEYNVTQHYKDIKLLYALKDYFGCGVVRKNKGKADESKVYSYRVRSRDHLNNIIFPFFEKHQLKSTKQQTNSRKVKKVLQLMDSNAHLTDEGLQQIRAIRKIISLR
tara:strand:- start:81 stop:509 length:429 start_codon:yes stop_codon:yes gene_type:complete